MKGSRWTAPATPHRPQIPSKRVHPADLVREAVAEAIAFGQRQGFGKVVGDRLMGEVIIVTFQGGQQISVPMPASANRNGPERIVHR